MSALLELAERCEKATGPDRGIDYKLACWFNPLADVPAYTASLDAAMTLVPGEWASIACGRTDDGRGWAHLAHNDGHMMAQDPDEFFVEADCATPALALCAAALRSRAAMSPHTQVAGGGE